MMESANVKTRPVRNTVFQGQLCGKNERRMGDVGHDGGWCGQSKRSGKRGWGRVKCLLCVSFAVSRLVFLTI